MNPAFTYYDVAALRKQAEPVTDEQIEKLAIEAISAQDFAMFEICQIALGTEENAIGPAGGQVTRSECRAECERVIREAQAQY